jgi:hypothetical protein
MERTPSQPLGHVKRAGVERNERRGAQRLACLAPQRGEKRQRRQERERADRRRRNRRPPARGRDGEHEPHHRREEGVRRLVVAAGEECGDEEEQRRPAAEDGVAMHRVFVPSPSDGRDTIRALAMRWGRSPRRSNLVIALVAITVVCYAAVTFATEAAGSSEQSSASLAQYVPPSHGGGGGALMPDLHVAVTASATATPAEGGEVDWYITVTTKNRGTSSNAELVLNLPTGWTYDHSYSDRGSGCTGSPPVLRCNVAWISPVDSTHVTLFGKVAQAVPLTLIAQVRSLQEPEYDPTDNTITVTVSPAPSTAPGGSGTSGSGTPAATAPLVLVGKAVTGTTLRVKTVAKAGYQWQLCTTVCRAIPGATKPALKLVRAYAGKSVRVVVTVGGGSAASQKLRVKLRA